LEVEVGPRRSLLSRIHEQDGNDCKPRHSDSHDTLIAALKEGGVVDQIMNAIDFEEIKARAIMVILRNKSRGAQLSGIMEKGKAQEGKVDGHDFLVRG
jgi:hypothetical protein